MKKLIAAAAACSLAACATVSDLRQTNPIVDVQSAKAVQAIAACISENLSKRSANVNATPRGNGTSLAMTGQFFSNTQAYLVVDIDDVGAHRTVRAYVKGGASTSNADPSGNSDITSCV